MIFIFLGFASPWLILNLKGCKRLSQEKCSRTQKTVCSYSVQRRKNRNLLPLWLHHQTQNHKQEYHLHQMLRITGHICPHHKWLATFLLCQSPTKEDLAVLKRKNITVHLYNNCKLWQSSLFSYIAAKCVRVRERGGD